MNEAADVTSRARPQGLVITVTDRTQTDFYIVVENWARDGGA